MEKPIRILHVLGNLNRGGAETMVMNLYRNMDRSKIQFDFVVHTEEKCAYEEEIIKLGGKIFRVPRYSGKNHFSYIKAWNELFQNHREYKIVHGHVRSTAAIYLKIAKKYDVITISHSHSTSSGTGIAAKIKNIFQFPIRYIADYFFACSAEAGEWLFGKRVIDKNNFYIIKNGINLQKFKFDEEKRNNKRKELGLKDKIVVGHVGRFTYPKNHEFLIEIFHELNKVNKNTILVLAGEGPLENEIHKKIQEYELNEDVLFLGSVDNIEDVFQMFDFFVFPSLYEGLGMVAIEAQSSGLTCFVSDNLPNDIMLTKKIHKISLEKGAKTWASEILQFLNDKDKRYNESDHDILKIYDINESSKYLEKIYDYIIIDKSQNLIDYYDSENVEDKKSNE